MRRAAFDIADPAHADRVLLIALSLANRILCVVYAERLDGAMLRIISARRATRHEEKLYQDLP